jgi:hypothetical protein
LYFSPNIIRIIKTRRMRWVGQEACMEKKHACRILVGNPEERGPYEDPDINGRIILGQISEK